MRLLIITQKMDQNDSVLGFMHGWVEEFAKSAEKATVICLEKGGVALPQNVIVYSLGKEKGKANRFLYGWRFVRYIVQTRKEYDAVFVHMNPEYVCIGGLLWKLLGKTVTLWYAHKSTPWFLRFAVPLTDIIFTSTQSGFRLASGKVKVVGQGIDTSKFKVESEKFKVAEGALRVVSVGRITPSKDYDTLLDAVEKFRRNTVPIHIDIFGPTSSPSDEAYLKKMEAKILEKGLVGAVFFKDPVANRELPGVLSRYDLFVNMGHTGSLDKAVPEAMASGLPILTCNEAFRAVLGPFTRDLMYEKGDSSTLAERMLKMAKLGSSGREKLGEELRQIVVKNHSLSGFVKKIISEIETHNDKR